MTRRRVPVRMLVGVLWALAAVLPAVGTAEPPDVVSGRLVREPRALVVEARIEPGWHVNAHQPRDEFLIPTTLEVRAPTGTTLGAVEYPRPVERTLAFSEEPLLLYEGTIRIRAAFTGAGTGRFEARLRYQACDDTRCLPPRMLLLALDDARSTLPGGSGGNPFTDLSSIPTGSAISKLDWKFGAGLISSDQNPTIIFSQPGKYPVTQAVYITYGTPYTKECSVELGRQIQIERYPQANFNHQFVCKDEVTQFTSFTGPGFNTEDYIVNYSWDFGDGTIVAGADQTVPNHTFGTVGTYNVKLTLETNLGCGDDTVKQVSILPYVTPTQDIIYTQSFEDDLHGWASVGLKAGDTRCKLVGM